MGICNRLPGCRTSPNRPIVGQSVLSCRPERLSCRPERPLSSRACEGSAFPRGGADQPRSSRRPHGRLGAALFVATRTVRASCPCVPPGISYRALAGWVGGLGIAAGQGRRELSVISIGYRPISSGIGNPQLGHQAAGHVRIESLSPRVSPVARSVSVVAWIVSVVAGAFRCRPERLLSSRACEGSALPRDCNRSLRLGETASGSELARSSAQM